MTGTNKISTPFRYVFRPPCWYDGSFTALQVDPGRGCKSVIRKSSSCLRWCVHCFTNSATAQNSPHRDEWGVDLVYCRPSAARLLWLISNAISWPAGDPLWAWANWASICMWWLWSPPFLYNTLWTARRVDLSNAAMMTYVTVGHCSKW